MTEPSTGYDPGPYDLLFSRDHADGSSERLVLVGNLCPNPECYCRDVNYYGYLIPGTSTDDLQGQNLGKQILDVTLNVDTGKFVSVRQSNSEVLAWLERELSDTDIAMLREKFDDVRAALRKSYDEEWKDVDWSFWNPGMRVSWVEAHPSFGSHIIKVNKRKFILLDDYCVTDECHCEQVHATCIEIIDDMEAELPIFEATVVPRDPQTLRLSLLLPKTERLLRKSGRPLPRRKSFMPGLLVGRIG